MKKIVAIFLALIMLVCAFPALASATNINSVKIRVEGINGTIASTAEGYTTSAVTAWDAVKELLDSKGIPYLHSFSTYWGVESVYISSINGETAGTFGGYDGWLYIVNGVSPWEGSANNYNVKNNDEIVFYYGDFAPGTFIPKLTVASEVKAGTQFEVDLQSTYDEYDANWNATSKTVKIPDVKVSFNGADYYTNSDGKVIITAPTTVGNYDLSISKTSANGIPAIVRNTVKVKVAEAVLLENLAFTSDRLVIGNNTCNVLVKNYTSESITPRLVVAVYNGTKLEKLSFSNVEDSVVGIGQNKNLQVNVALSNVEGCTAKAFVVEDLENIRPLGDFVILD